MNLESDSCYIERSRDAMDIDILSCSNQQLWSEEEVDSCQQKVEHGQRVMKSSGMDDKTINFFLECVGE